MEFLAEWLSQKMTMINDVVNLGSHNNPSVTSFKIHNDFYNVTVSAPSNLKLYRVIDPPEFENIAGVYTEDRKSVFLDAATIQANPALLKSKSCLKIDPCDDFVRPYCCPRSKTSNNTKVIILFAISLLFISVIIITVVFFKIGAFKNWKFNLFAKLK